MAAVDLLYAVRRYADLDPVNIDGFVFRLHHWITSTAILAASLVAFAKQYFGDPIECIFDAKHGAEIKAVDAYCWLHSTVNLDTSLLRKLNTLPKIRNPCHGFPTAEHDIDTLYYQWVPFFLLFQALIFRLPWHLWRHLEGGRMADFGLEAKRHLVLADEDASEALAHQYASLFRGILHRNNVYFWQFFFCETLNLVIVVGVILATDSFLNGRFISYGKKVVEYYQQNNHQHNQHHQHHGRDDERGSGGNARAASPMCSLFPTVTSCQFPSGALTGNLNVDHAMCILSLNIVNDKIFLIEWFWFFSLAVLSAAASLATCLCVVFPRLRKMMIRSRARCHSPHELHLLDDLLSRCYIGDWFVLQLLAKNTNAYMYRRILKATADRLSEEEEEGGGQNGRHDQRASIKGISDSGGSDGGGGGGRNVGV